MHQRCRGVARSFLLTARENTRFTISRLCRSACERDIDGLLNTSSLAPIVIENIICGLFNPKTCLLFVITNRGALHLPRENSFHSLFT